MLFIYIVVSVISVGFCSFRSNKTCKYHCRFYRKDVGVVLLPYVWRRCIFILKTRSIIVGNICVFMAEDWWGCRYTKGLRGPLDTPGVDDSICLICSEMQYYLFPSFRYKLWSFINKILIDLVRISHICDPCLWIIFHTDTHTPTHIIFLTAKFSHKNAS